MNKRQRKKERIKELESALGRLVIAVETGARGREDDTPCAIIHAKYLLLFRWDKDGKLVLR